MGLAAGQARLLTITGRKSDCEFESMRLSHQKLALARDLTDISNEYQNSLTQTKLVYDYYGTGDTSTQLSYGLLMNPSILNDYMPTLITNSQNRAILNSKYAAAAAAAGIPQEGLGSLPSDTMRNEFIQALYEQGVITSQLTSETIQSLPYNQSAGLGGGATVAVTTDSGNITSLIDYISNNSTALGCSNISSTYSFDRSTCKTGNNQTETSKINIIKGSEGKPSDCSSSNWNNTSQISLGDLLSSDDDKQYYLAYEGVNGEQTPVYGVALMQEFLTDSDGFIDWLNEQFSAILDIGDGYTSQALEYAYNMTTELVLPTSTESYQSDWIYQDDGDKTDDNTQHSKSNVYNYIDPVSNQWCDKGSEDEKYQQSCVYDSRYCIGFSTVNSGKGGGDDGNDNATAGINLNNIAKAFLTYFADYMNGISKVDSNGVEIFDVNKGALETVKGTDYVLTSNHLATSNYTYQYTWAVGTEVSSDDLGQATFYDALFNQLCTNGWIENNNVTDNDYLQQMLQNGMMYISKVKDDNYYYQGNYSTDTYINEVTDDSAVAYAEAKYNTEKAKINAKEETLDLKMKNLDTEISSLSTEYDTVKNTISKNIEKSFKRYNA